MKYILLISLLFSLLLSKDIKYSKMDSINFIKSIGEKDLTQEEYQYNYFMSIDENLKKIIRKKAKEFNIKDVDRLYNLKSGEKFSSKYIITKYIIDIINGKDKKIYKKNREMFYVINVNKFISEGELSKAFEYLYIVSEDVFSPYIDEDLIDLATVASNKAFNNKSYSEAYIISYKGWKISKSLTYLYKNGEAGLKLLKIMIKSRNELIKNGNDIIDIKYR